MWKVLIADDEPKIRQGLKETLESFGLPLEICSEAKNGMEALEKTKECRPDLLLVDICMPKLSGIKFLEEIKKLQLDCCVIIISGFNEFTYAKQAIKLGVSCYLLKPISEEELRDAVEETIKELEKRKHSKKLMELMDQQIQQNKNYLRDIFFNEWIEGNLSENEWKEQMEFLGIRIPKSFMLVLISVQSGYEANSSGATVKEEVYRMTLEKAMRDLTEKYRPVYIFMNRYQEVVGIVGGYREETEKLRMLLTKEMERLIGGKCCVQIEEGICESITEIYERLRVNAGKIMECRPIVMDARKYIYQYYDRRDLDLTQVAEAIGCNPSYLSRIMKQELGISFKDFLTMLRISRAIQLMRNPEFSINQIAEKVGYSNQHYFSAAFKNCQGVSPSEFRRNLT